MTPLKDLLKLPVKDIPIQIDEDLIKNFKLIVVAYSHVDRDMFPTEEAYIAENEVVERAQEVADLITKIGIEVKCYPADEYFLTKLIIDKPDLVINLVDTLKGRDNLQTSIPASLELLNIPYTGAGMQGLVIGNNRYMTKQLMVANNIPTPDFQYIKRAGTKIDEELGFPLIAKINEGGGSVGIDNKAVLEKPEQARDKVDFLIKEYRLPVIIEKFVDGKEITVCVIDDGNKKQAFMAEKIFRFKPDGKHNFTSLESYDRLDAYYYRRVDPELEKRISACCIQGFNILRHCDYGKFDIRVDVNDNFYITDANPNTAFGPDKGLPFTEVLALHKIEFMSVLLSLLTKHAKRIQQLQRCQQPQGYQV